MTLSEGQVQVGDLVMGPGTAYRVLAAMNPWTRQVRADQGDERAWNHGRWSGSEWMAEATIPIPVMVEAADLPGWMAAHRVLQAAFAPSSSDVELRYCLGGVEYLMYGRPRMVEPDVTLIGDGRSATRCAFAALDPLTYAGTEQAATMGLPIVSGGLVVPVTAPLTVDATVVAGRITATNAGTADAGLSLRIDGPVVEPWVAVTTGTTVRSLRFWMTLVSGQWLDVDTAARTVLMNGTASRRGVTTVEGDWPVIPPGSSDLAFNATTYDASAMLTVAWRDAWY